MNGGKKTPSLTINAILNSTCSILSIVFPLITYPYVAHLLGADNLGKVNFASSTITYFSLISVLGITSYSAREGMQYRDNQSKLNKFSSELFTLSLYTTLFSLILLVIAIISIPKLQDYKGLFLIYGSTILFSPFSMAWLYTLEEDFLYITTRSIAIQCISMVLLFVVVRKPEDYYKYAALNAFSNVGANIFNFAYSKKYIKIHICLHLSDVFKHLKSCLVFFSSSIASSIYSNIDTTMLGFFSTDYHIGIYAASVKIYTMIKTILSSITAVMSPRLTFYQSHKMEDAYNYLISKVIKIMISLLFPVVVGLILVATEVIVVICGKEYIEAAVSLRILALAIFFAMFATVVNGCILLPNRFEKIVLRTTIAAAVVNVITNFVAIPLWQQNGAAVTTVLAELTVLIVGWRHARNLTKLNNMRNVIITSILGCISIVFIFYLLCSFIQSSLMRLLINVPVCIVTYGLTLLLLKNEIITEYFEQIKGKFLRKLQ